METIQIHGVDDDSPEFIAEVRACVNGVLCINSPAELIIINIDNWFGQRWLHFAGKALGAVGVWRDDERLTVPPFVPRRVRSEHRFLPPRYERVFASNPIHIPAESQHALRRRISQIAPGASFVWYSGGSKRSGRGAIMAYLYSEESYWTWYVELTESKIWCVTTAKGITALEFTSLKKGQESETFAE
jgi:hypothetical protein